MHAGLGSRETESKLARTQFILGWCIVSSALAGPNLGSTGAEG